MSTWRDSVLAAEAKKAGSANEDTRLTQRPPSLTDRLAWVHWKSLRSELMISCIERLRRSSNFARELWPTDGEHLKRWRTFLSTKRWPQKYQSILRVNGAQSANCSGKVVATFFSTPCRVLDQEREALLAEWHPQFLQFYYYLYDSIILSLQLQILPLQ